MMSSIHSIQVASTTTFSPVVIENTSMSTIGTTNPAMSAPRLSFGYSMANLLAFSSMASRYPPLSAST